MEKCLKHTFKTPTQTPATRALQNTLQLHIVATGRILLHLEHPWMRSKEYTWRPEQIKSFHFCSRASFQNEDKHRFTLTKVMPSAQKVHPIGYGMGIDKSHACKQRIPSTFTKHMSVPIFVGTYRRISIQSQSFPDLTGKSDVNFDRNIKLKSDSFRVTNRSRLPVASRWAIISQSGHW